MKKEQRVQAALRSEAVDRVPLSLWRHFHREDRTPQGLAETTVAFANEYDLDLVKHTPAGLYAVEDWAGSHIVYPGTDHDPPFLGRPGIGSSAGWRRLGGLDPEGGALGRELEAIRLVVAGLRQRSHDDRPLVAMTIFSPLTLAVKLAGERAFEDLRTSPADLHSGLDTITQTTVDFSRAALAAGADGLFFATQLASHQCFTPAEYAEFGKPYDLAVLRSIGGESAITVLHLHGHDVFFDLADTYPVDAVSWHDRETPPPLREAQQRTEKAFITGLDLAVLREGPEERIHAQVQGALAEAAGRGLILAPCCVIPTDTPARHLHAVRNAISPA